MQLASIPWLLLTYPMRNSLRVKVHCALAAFAYLLLSPVVGRGATPQTNDLQRFEFKEPEMGVPFRIVLYATDPATAHDAARAAFDRVAQLNQIMSDYETDSELNELSR